MAERDAMLSAPLTQLERDALVQYTGPEYCDECRHTSAGLCSKCAVRLRYEATVRDLEDELRP